jgi:integrase
MATKRQPERQPNDNQGVAFAAPSRLILMRGIRTFEKPRGTRRFFLSWRDEGRRRAKAFESDKAREKFARSLMAARERIGRQAMSFDPDEWVNWLRFKDVVGAVDPLTVAREWLAWRRGETDKSPVLADAVETFGSMVATSGASGDMRRRYRVVFDSFSDFAGAGVRLGSIQSAKIIDWLAALKKQRGFSAQTLKHYRQAVAALFKHFYLARAIGWNPCDAVAAPRVRAADVSVLSLADGVRLFEANRGLPVATRLALEAFGGLRYTSAIRLERHEVDWENRALRFPSAKHKSGRDQYVEGYPDNLWVWLAAAPAAAWEMTPRQYLNEKAAAFARAGVGNPGNVLRHSFCSYHVAMHRDAARTAVLLTHTSPVMLYRHYKGKATAADAGQWFSILPPLSIKRGK